MTTYSLPFQEEIQPHPRQPLTGDLKMHFRFGARIFNAASNLTSKWTPVFLLLAGILVIIDKCFVAGMGKQVWQRNTQELTGKK